MIIGNWDSRSGHTFVVAEIGTAHGGDYQRAERMVQAAVAAGADAVKFQVYNADLLVSPKMPALVPTHETQLERMRSLQLPPDRYAKLAQIAKQGGAVWFGSVFDEDSLELVDALAPCIKIASGELTNLSLLRAVAERGKPVLLSTGMATIVEINRALRALDNVEVALLHCVSLYPTPPEQANLPHIEWLRTYYHKNGVGYSDHCAGTSACLAAVALGAQIVEKHFTDLRQPEAQYAGGDHVHSLDVDGLRGVVSDIRAIERMRQGWPGERPDVVNRTKLRRNFATGLREG